jgi:O-antigen/teichoic acid export membrane protein
MINLKNVISTNEEDNVQELTDAAQIKKRSIKGVISYMGQMVAMQGITFVATVVLGGFLTTAEFGVYFIVTAVLGLFTFLSDVGLASALIQKKEEPTIADLRTAFTVQQILAITIFIVVVALTPVWRTAQKLEGTELWLLYVVAASFFLITFKTIPSILLNRKLRFDLLVLPALAENVVFYSIVTVFAVLGYGIKSFLFAILARDIVGILFMYKLQSWPIGIGFSKKSFHSLIKFGFKFQLNDLLARIKDDLFTVVITSVWLDKDSIGLIAFAKKWSQFPQQLSINSVAAVTFPTYSRLQHDATLLRKAIEKTLYFITLAAFPLLIGVAIFMIPFTHLFVRYEKWQPAMFSLALFCLNIGLSTLSTPLTNTLNAVGHVNQTLKLMIMWTVLTWVITPICIKFFGFEGVAIASAIIGSSSLVTVWMVKKIVPFSIIPSVWRQFVAGFGMVAFGVAGLPLWDNSWLHFFAGGIATGLVFVIVFLVVGAKSLQIELASLGLWKKHSSSQS